MAVDGGGCESEVLSRQPLTVRLRHTRGGSELAFLTLTQTKWFAVINPYALHNRQLAHVASVSGMRMDDASRSLTTDVIEESGLAQRQTNRPDAKRPSAEDEAAAGTFDRTK